MPDFDIKIQPQLCTGCRRCQLVCSDLFYKKFNPRKARIKVKLTDTDCSISFTNQCNLCGVCADHCFYGALQKTARKAG